MLKGEDNRGCNGFGDSGRDKQKPIEKESLERVDPVEELIHIVNEAQERDAEDERRLYDLMLPQRSLIFDKATDLDQNSPAFSPRAAEETLREMSGSPVPRRKKNSPRGRIRTRQRRACGRHGGKPARDLHLDVVTTNIQFDINADKFVARGFSEPTPTACPAHRSTLAGLPRGPRGQILARDTTW
jgi:hypothetical protein